MATTANPSTTATPGNIPRFVTYTSPVSLATANDGNVVRASTLPLNLIALIVSHLDNLGDIARVTRTSRLLYYMTLPQLYAKVDLHSYSSIRYVNGKPEGFGGGSPITMALNGLVTKTHASLVQELRLWGEWKELGIDDFAKGRVPDTTMMLNILLRAATDRMTKLKAFSWELDCKPLKTLYQGLSTHSTLTSLTLRFPNSKSPRPSVIIPPMANLRAFRALDIDPLCYPDDISVLLLNSKKLEDLRLHFSPRMRREAESSLRVDTYFGRCIAANYKLQIKHFAMQNFYGANSQGVANIVSHDTCKSITFLDMFGGVKGNSANVFLDDTWKDIPRDFKTDFRQTRTNEPATQHVQMLSNSSGMERLYFVGSKHSKTSCSPEAMDGLVTPEASPPDIDATALGKQYLYALTRHHGSSLKHLLLSDQWLLDHEDLGDLVRYCPNLEQLGLAVHQPSHLDTVRLLLPFLPKLKALRLLGSEGLMIRCNEQPAGKELESMGIWVEKMHAPQLSWMGIGDTIFKINGTIEVPQEGGTIQKLRDVKETTWEDAKKVEIWGLDVLDIMVDPVGPFST